MATLNNVNQTGSRSSINQYYPLTFNSLVLTHYLLILFIFYIFVLRRTQLLLYILSNNNLTYHPKLLRFKCKVKQNNIIQHPDNWVITPDVLISCNNSNNSRTSVCCLISLTFTCRTTPPRIISRTTAIITKHFCSASTAGSALSLMNSSITWLIAHC